MEMLGDKCKQGRSQQMTENRFCAISADSRNMNLKWLCHGAEGHTQQSFLFGSAQTSKNAIDCPKVREQRE